MNNGRSTIFRPEAVRQYRARANKKVFPLPVSPGNFLLLWFLVCLLLVGVAATAAVEVPKYLWGQAVWLRGEGGPAPEVRRLLVLLPTPDLPQVKIGQKAFLCCDGNGVAVRGTVTEVMPDTLSPEEVSRRFPLSTPPRARAQERSTVAVVEISPEETVQPHPGKDKTFIEARIQVGSSRLITFVR